VSRSKISRRRFLATTIGAAGLIGPRLNLTGLAETRRSVSGNLPVSKIDRKALVTRHNPSLQKLDPSSPLSVGNGEFAFTSDITGLQTFHAEYENRMPLCTMSQWGWHTTPLAGGLDPKALRLTQYDTHGRSVGYHTSGEGQGDLFNWLRQNPHRLSLGQIGLRLLKSDHVEGTTADISDIDQQLDLWTGILTSRFRFQGESVLVRTAVHPDLDQIAVAIESPLIGARRLGVRFAFPYGSPEMTAAAWDQADRHQSSITKQDRNGVHVERTLDDDKYYVGIRWVGDASFTAEKAHSFVLTRTASLSASRDHSLEFIAAFSPQPFKLEPPEANATFAASSAHWQRFWTTGGVVELADSRDNRAADLERRVVLSQYLTAIQCAGSLPPQETGLTVNSWYGKFHLEMHWWHATHFALWNRLPLFEKSLHWYDSILASAKARARSQGYAGARWPKMVGPDGRDSPSPIGPLLIWQQTHPISYAELCYQTRRDRRTLERYRQIVFESAEFMASYAYFETDRQRYVLGPPLIPAQENHPPRETWNPTFELAQWAHGLRMAQLWRERLGMKRKAEWDRVIAGLAPLPVRNGVYLAHENCPQTFTERNHDHPSMLGALGMLPGVGVDRAIMRRTLDKVMKEWQWETTWGWDYPLTAMTAARLGVPKLAVDSLLMTTEKNRYLTNGHNWQRQNLPCYLPGNGGLLYAIAMMAVGWRGSPPGHAPGFPTDGSWTVRSENIHSSLLREL
jgi:hypothetical protein